MLQFVTTKIQKKLQFVTILFSSNRIFIHEIRSVIPIRMALRFCPEAKIVNGDMEILCNMLHIVTEISKEKTAIIAKLILMNFT
ncbi:hypothetical protein RM51_03585 [Chryseobacterium taiwanense]|uniref:Uncharacterized protein n=1 Tax=Chryseobacterium taiwanense TaxID=363331 RepID=A0A0B4EDA7_9FLAO|nr:hypothetical protein RM51_03585 [Chryseobacterium taiwanense]